MGKRPSRVIEQARQEERRVAERHLTGSGRIRQIPLTEARKRIFLDELKRHGVVAEAARVATPTSLGTPSSTFYNEKERDPVFAAEWDESVEQANGKLEMEAIRRATVGVERGVFQRGQRVVDQTTGKPASETEYSDRLLEVLLRGRIPKRFGDHRHVQIEGAVRHVHEDAHDGLFIGVSDLSLLSDAQRRNLYDVLATLARAKGEAGDAIDAEFEMVESDPAALPSPDPANTPLASLADADMESLSPDEAAALAEIL